MIGGIVALQIIVADDVELSGKPHGIDMMIEASAAVTGRVGSTDFTAATAVRRR